MEYKLKTINDEDIKSSVIEKIGSVIEFQFSAIDEHETQLKKALKELMGTGALQKAKMDNIEAHHPFVLEMKEQDMFTAHMYQEAKAIYKGALEKITQVEKILADYAEEKAEIVKQIPELAEKEAVLSPIQPTDLGDQDDSAPEIVIEKPEEAPVVTEKTDNIEEPSQPEAPAI